MREPRYSLLADIQYDIELARQGKFALYGQRNIAREYRCKKATPEEQQAYETLQNVLFMVPQWSDTEELHSDMERIGGRVWFCYFWNDHDSMIQLTEDSCGTFTTAYVLDADITPEMHKSAARQAQQQLAVCMQEWGIPLMKSFVPEKVRISGGSSLSPDAGSQCTRMHYGVKIEQCVFSLAVATADLKIDLFTLPNCKTPPGRHLF